MAGNIQAIAFLLTSVLGWGFGVGVWRCRRWTRPVTTGR
jgi:hypothetical protein